MGGKREVAALHFFMGHAVAFSVISILEIFIIQKKSCKTILQKLPGQRAILPVFDGEGEYKLQQCGM
ncbi:hypothetical protein D3C75_811980 [compost metagenome]